MSDAAEGAKQGGVNAEPERLKESDWKNLLKQIRRGKCLPFIGPEACAGVYETKAQVAERWAREEGYPLSDRTDLARVAQFLSVEESESYPIDKLVDEYEGHAWPNRNDPDEPHRVLASLPLPVYITTNYDDFMTAALGSEQIGVPRDVRREFCHWRGTRDAGAGLPEGYKPIPAAPVVFHLFGHTNEPSSIVLTDNDYLKFLVNVSADQGLIPPLISGPIANSSLLFLGYQLDDWDFRILYHSISGILDRSLSKAHISVQLEPGGARVTDEEKENAKKYLDLYFQKLDIRVYWGTCREFVKELRRRWEAF